jgi:excinuclease ABC subunit A
LPVGDVLVTPENEARLRELLAQALEYGKGVVHLLSPLDKLAEALEKGLSTLHMGRVKVFSTERACPACGTSYPELDPRLFSYNSKHGWCPDCVGTGLELTREQRKVLDDSHPDDKSGREQTFAEPDVEDVTDASLRHLPRRPPEPHRTRGAFGWRWPWARPIDCTTVSLVSQGCQTVGRTTQARWS